MCKKHNSLANFRESGESDFFVHNFYIFKLEIKNLNVRSSTKTALRISATKILRKCFRARGFFRRADLQKLLGNFIVHQKKFC